MSDSQHLPGKRSSIACSVTCLGGARDNAKIPELRRAHLSAPDRPYFATTARSRGEGSFVVVLVKADSFRAFYSR